MADNAEQEAKSAEQAYAAAAEVAPAKAKPVVEAPVAKAPSPPAEVKPAAILDAALVKTAPKPAPAKKIATKCKVPAKAKVTPKPKATTKPAVAAKTKAPAKAAIKSAKPKIVAAKPAVVPPAAPTAKAVKTKSLPGMKPAFVKPIIELKDTIMAKTPDFTKSMTDAMSEVQTRAKAAYEKSTEVATEISDFTKGNVEALMESGKILSEGVQDIGKTCADEAKAAFETMTADMKEIAAIKSPTELFQLQGKLMRRNFDSFVAFSSKSSEAMVKLANEAVAPLSSRMSLAADKVSKAAA